MQVNFVPLADAEPDEAVVVIDVLRAFTVQPWLFHRGASRILAVAGEQQAVALRDEHLPHALLAGEEGGVQLEGFDLGNSPTQVAQADVVDRTIIHRTSAGTQGLARTTGSGLVLAAAFVTADATAQALRVAAPSRVTFVITGASQGRDGDEDLAAAELIAARARGDDPDPEPFTARVATSDAGRNFVPGGPAWAPPDDLARCIEVDRFDHTLLATVLPELDAIEVGAHRAG
ncbi:MAG: 2-phosphosulfolactate phosphatase [Nitriliruptor sp.]|nr:MAG: 2-phosphosulfolactate phosphatase [Nitriliruptor sp.]